MVNKMYYKRLKDLREDHDLYQKDVAKVINVAQQYYSEYEQGNRPIPLEKVIILANFYNTSIDYIVNRTDTKKPYPKKNTGNS